MICSMGQKVSLNVRIKSKGFTWKSSLNNATDFFGTTILLATVPCPFKISQNIPIFPNNLGYSLVPIQNIPKYPNISQYSWPQLGAHSKYPRLSQYSWLQLGAHPGDHLHDHPGAGLLEHRHSCRVKI